MSAWYYLVDNQPTGPIDEPELQGHFAAGTLAPEILVWKEGMENWLPAHQLPVFFASAGPTVALPSLPKVETISSATSALSHPVVLVQKDLLRGQQSFEILDPAVLQFRSGKGKKSIVGQIKLASLNPQPQHRRKIHIASAVVAAPMVLLSLPFLVGTFVVPFTTSKVEDIMAVLLLDFFIFGFTAILVANAYARRQNAIVFTSTTNNGAGLSLWFENPDKKTFDEFIAQLQTAIERAHSQVHGLVPEIKLPEASKNCIGCQSPQILPGYPTPLCQSCRETMIKRPVPRWLKIAAIVLGMMLLWQATRLPGEISASLSYERGKIAQDKGNYTLAIQDYQVALAKYPRSEKILAGLALSSYRAGDRDAAIKYADQIIRNTGPDQGIEKSTADIIHQVKEPKP